MPEVCLRARPRDFSAIQGRMRLPRPIKNFEKDFAGCQTTMRRQRGEFNCLPVELEGGATPGWWTSSCFAQVRAAYTPAGQDSPPGVVFLLAQPKARQVNGNLKIEGAKAPSTSCDCGPARWHHSRERGCRRTIRKTAAPNCFAVNNCAAEALTVALSGKMGACRLGDAGHSRQFLPARALG